jgi:hypothetical protein
MEYDDDSLIGIWFEKIVPRIILEPKTEEVSGLELDSLYPAPDIITAITLRNVVFANAQGK